MQLDMLFYLLFCLTNALLYSVIKLFSKTLGISPLHLASYMNIGVFIIYNVLFFKKIWKRKMYLGVFQLSNLLLCASVISALTKMYCIKYIEPRDAIIITYTTPFLVMLFAAIFLKEKSIPKYWICGLFSLIGVCIYVEKKISVNSVYYAILLLHVLFKAIMHIATKKASKKGVFVVLFYDNLFYSMFATSFFVYNGDFDYKLLFSWQILLLMIITSISLYGLAKAYKIAKKGITRLQNLDFSKIIFSFVLAVLLLNDKIDDHELLGASIILLSIIISQINWISVRKQINKILKEKEIQT